MELHCIVSKEEDGEALLADSCSTLSYTKLSYTNYLSTYCTVLLEVT